MPELPEVETVCRGLRPKLEGRVLVDVVQRRPDLRYPFPENFAARLQGRTIERIDRRAKYILAHLDDGWTLMIHLGMSGRMTLTDEAPPRADKHDHVELRTDEGTTVRFNDARRFGFMDLIRTAALDVYPMLASLGPEPLSNAFNEVSLSEALRGRKTPIKSALLDQKVVAGLGNIYVCEALFRAFISPKRSAHTVPGQRAARLVPAIRDVLTSAIAAGGSSLRDYVQADGELGYFQHNWRVYGRDGESCGQEGCDCTIRRIVQSGRSTFYCGKHQR
ncbi:MAG: bifunctional DNA-formamidopyrimidine glycosylase/DNA-(apurinic or apyrimidinic site) lyase [Pseudomonadota bacterium]|nr:bifunctional DNA-formamidopyrimidine glycosylase/DNA-(apurinic or apyrimidinic site) lyase [Pseudomonadota bacterium]